MSVTEAAIRRMTVTEIRLLADRLRWPLVTASMLEPHVRVCDPMTDHPVSIPVSQLTSTHVRCD